MISNKITHLITTIERGGAEKQLLILASEQVKSGLQVEVFYLKGRPELKNELEAAGVLVNSRLVGKNFFRQILIFFNCLRNSPSPVHAHLPQSELLAALAVSNKHFIFSRHNAEPFWPGSPKIISNLLSKFVCKRAAKGIAISNAVKNYLMDRGEIPQNYPIDVVYYGFQKETSLNPKGLEIVTKLVTEKSSNYRIGTIGRLVPQKDYPTLLNSFSAVLKNTPKVDLYIVGEGYLQKDLIELTRKLGIDKNVHWLGKTEFINEFLSSIDLFILSSKYEGFGLVLLEAMISQKPIIAANNSAIPEVLGKSYKGLFPTGDINALTSKINSAITDSNYSDDLVKSLVSQLTFFDPKEMNKKVNHVYSNAGF
jgi:glycosyltransferase involved in cell wall biosynthesis